MRIALLKRGLALLWAFELEVMKEWLTIKNTNIKIPVQLGVSKNQKFFTFQSMKVSKTSYFKIEYKLSVWIDTLSFYNICTYVWWSLLLEKIGEDGFFQSKPILDICC